MPVDFTGATQADIQPVDPTTGQVIVRKAQPADQPVSSLAGITPDVTTQDPNTFAALTAHNYLQTTYAQGLSPTGDKVQDVFAQALKDANEYRRTTAQQQQAKQLELLARGTAVTTGLLGQEEAQRAQAQKQAEAQYQIYQLTPQKAFGNISPLVAQKSAESGVEVEKAREIKQAEQGPAAQAAELAAEKAGQAPGVTYALPEADIDTLTKAQVAYEKLNDISNLHGQLTNIAGAGGFLKSKIGGLFTQPGITSEIAKNFNALTHASTTTIATGVFGDTAAKSTQPNVQKQIAESFPTEEDNLAQGGNKLFMLKKALIDQVQSMHDNRTGKFDTGKIDALLARMHSDFDTQDVQKYNPYDLRNKNLVTVGETPEGKAQVAAGASKGVQTTQGGAPTPIWATSAIQQPGASGNW